MVIQGDYSLKLINASTMKPLPEHSSSTGKRYVTVAPNTDFLVQLEPLPGVHSSRPIFYQTLISNSATASRHTFKRRQLLKTGINEKPNIFRFDRTTHKAYDSVAMEKVTVRIYQQSENHDRKLLEVISVYCCVVPSIKPVGFGARATSLGSLLAGSVKPAFSSHPKGQCCLWKKNSNMTTTERSRLTPEKLSAPPMVL